MPSSRTFQLLEALGAQLSVIRTAAGYFTDIGSKIILQDRQREATHRPSIAIGSRTGRLNRADERSASGRALSTKARSMDLIIEAACKASLDDAERVAHEMLEDIERAFALQTCGAPRGFVNVQLDTWQILDRPDGIDAVVLQVLGTADFVRK